MSFNHGSIYMPGGRFDQTLLIKFETQRLQYPLHHALLLQVAKAVINCLPRSVTFWKISPTGLGVEHPEYTIEQGAVIPAGTAKALLLPVQQWLYNGPLLTTQFI
jgi:hypothetical protein